MMKMPSADTFTRHTDCPAQSLPLSDIERRVVHLVRTDATRGRTRSARRTWLRVLITALFGDTTAPPLSEPRLEALRLYACAVRRNDPAAAELARQLRTLGYSADAIGTATAMARR